MWLKEVLSIRGMVFPNEDLRHNKIAVYKLASLLTSSCIIYRYMDS